MGVRATNQAIKAASGSTLQPQTQQQTPIATDMFIPNLSGIASNQDAMNALNSKYVLKKGDTMTGNLTISPASSYLRLKDNYVQDSSNKLLLKGANGVTLQQYSGGWVNIGDWNIAQGLVTNYAITANTLDGSTSVSTDGAFYCQSFEGISQDIVIKDSDGATHTLSFVGGILFQYTLT